MKFKRIIPGLLFLWCLPAGGLAQGASQEKEPNPEVAIVALGPKPPRTYREPADGSDPVMLLAKPGETPPSRLFYRSGGNREEGGGRWTPMNLAFNNPGALREIPADQELRLYREVPGEEDYQHYTTLPAVPAGVRRVFFLLPSKFNATPWADAPRLKVLTLENSNLIDKQFILANFSQHTVQHAFDDTVEVVAPDRILAYQRDKVGEIYRLAAVYGNERKIIYNTAVRLSQEGHIQLFALYDANPATNAGRDVGAFRMTIPVRETEAAPEG